MNYIIRIKSTIFQYGFAMLFFLVFVFSIPKGSINPTLLFIFYILIFALGVWLGSKLTLGKAKIILTDSSFEIRWIKKAPFSTLENTILSLDQLNGWKYRKENSYDYFILYNSKGQDLMFYRDTIWDPDKDDFGKFLTDFKKTIRRHNNQERIKTKVSTEKTETQSPKLIIDKEASFHNSTKGKLALYVYIVSLIFGIYGLITKWDELGYRRGFLIGLLAMCVGLIFDHLNKRKRNSS